MKYTLTFLPVIALFILFSLPNTVSAYGTSAQIAHRMNDSHVLYMISYDFGFLNRETDLPIAAYRDAFSNNEANVRYDLVDKEGNVSTTGVSHALVISDREIVDNRYHLDQGKAGKFTLVVVYEHAAPLTEPLALQITHLPLILTKEDGTKKDFILAPSELKAYVTPFEN